MTMLNCDYLAGHHLAAYRLPIEKKPYFLNLSINAENFINIYMSIENELLEIGTHIPNKNVASYVLKTPLGVDRLILANGQETSITIDPKTAFSVKKLLINPFQHQVVNKKALVAIHCWGKVGSVTIEKGFSDSLDVTDVMRTHHMRPEEFHGASIRHAEQTKHMLNQARSGPKFIFTGLRDTAEITLAGFFQNHGDFLVRCSASVDTATKLWLGSYEYLLQRYEKWWNKEFLDLYNMPEKKLIQTVEKMQGYCDIHHNGVNHIIYDITSIDDAINAVRSRIGLARIKPIKHNQANKKNYWDLYNNIKSQLPDIISNYPLPPVLTKLQAAISHRSAF